MCTLLAKALAIPSHKMASKILSSMFTQAKCTKGLRRNLVILINSIHQYSGTYFESHSSFYMSFGH